jgi:choline-sulfatase
MDGASLLGVAEGGRGPVPMEYMAEGSAAPLVALRDGDCKLSVCELDPPLLFDLRTDPHELRNLADDPAHAGVLAELSAKVRARWDLARLDAEVRASQARRHLVYEALRNGAHFPWDYQPLQRASERYMRNHMNLDGLEAAQRFPKEGA